MRPRKQAEDTKKDSAEVKPSNGKRIPAEQPEIDPELMAEFKQWETASDEDFWKLEDSLDDE